MGGTESKCASLLTQMGWERPQFHGDFHNPSLVGFLEGVNLEVTLPKHAPQADLSIGDRKPAMYPRPNFCWEGCKMHLALIGPSTACKNQLTSFLPKIVDTFKGPPSRLGPGREAIPYYFFDEELHRTVLWELPEIAFRQNCEDYIRELGLLYIDCVFMLFSDKYLLTDIYCKLCVAMAIHGVPFFVLCTMSGEEVDDVAWRKLKSDFQKKDIQVRMFHPAKPQESLEEILSEFIRVISWNRGHLDRDLTDGLAENILGQTIRLKNLQKKPELNGRCGVCIGFDKDQSRYRVRLINNGVETDLAIKQDCLSVLKPKLHRCIVKIKGLESKPELNGRYGFVDEFLRENERYRVFVPDVPGTAMTMALKPANLEKVDSFRDAKPVPPQPKETKPVRQAAPKPTTRPAPKPAAQPEPRPPSSMPTPSVPAAAAVPPGGKPGAFDPLARDKPANSSAGFSQKPSAASSNSMRYDGRQDDDISSLLPKAKPTAKPAAKPAAAPAATPAAKPPRIDSNEDDDIESLLPKLGGKEEQSDDLMSRILAAEAEADDLSNIFGKLAEESQRRDTSSSAKSQPSAPVKSQPSAPATSQELQFSRAGLLAMRVWAVMGDPEPSEDIVDHLMDCGKTVFNIGKGDGAHVESVVGLASDPRLPKAEVLVFFEANRSNMKAIVDDAMRSGVHGAILHPDAETYDTSFLRHCRDIGFIVHAADVFETVVPGAGIEVAPLN